MARTLTLLIVAMALVGVFALIHHALTRRLRRQLRAAETTIRQIAHLVRDCEPLDPQLANLVLDEITLRREES